METVWDLIYRWTSAQAEADRKEAAAREARQAANDLDRLFREALRKHGPIKHHDDLYLPPASPDEPIRVQAVQDSLDIPLEPAANTPA